MLQLFDFVLSHSKVGLCTRKCQQTFPLANWSLNWKQILNVLNFQACDFYLINNICYMFWALGNSNAATGRVLFFYSKSGRPTKKLLEPFSMTNWLWNRQHIFEIPKIGSLPLFFNLKYPIIVLSSFNTATVRLDFFIQTQSYAQNWSQTFCLPD